MVWMLGLMACSDLQAVIVDNYPLEYSPPEAVVSSRSVELELIADGFDGITDIQFFPASDNKALIAQKEGQVSVLTLGETPTIQRLTTISVRTRSEQGVLGIAFHPSFTENQLVYIHLTPSKGVSRTEVSEWHLNGERLTKRRILLELDQPYANHNGGQILFGPDGYLYIGLGDGGWRNDPHSHGQNKETLLGTIVRLDVNGEPYLIPSDNPFVNDPNAHPLIWAYGLRNPWRFSFLEDGRIVTGDVGQGDYEEVSVLSKGENLGWNIKEGRHCFAKDTCDSSGLVDPVFEYSHDLGTSITGGYVVKDGSTAQGKYVFGDFTSGRIWLMDVERERSAATEILQSGLNISTFGRSAGGTIYVGDYGNGGLYRLLFN